MNRAPLTALQQSMVLASMRAPRSGAYLIQEICETIERLDLEILRRAWRRMADRHTALRTSIEIDSKGNLWQSVNPAAKIPLQEAAWNVPAEQEPSKLATWLEHDRARGFDFHAGVPARITLIRRAHSSTLVWTTHHAFLDGRSFLMAWQEWFAFYEAFSSGTADPVLPRAPSFSDHLGWLQQQDWTSSQSYWEQNLAGLRETTGYVIDRISPSLSSRHERTDRREVCLSPELTRALESFAEQHSVTVNTLIQAAWALLLARYSDRREVVFGVTRACRRSSIPDAASMLGLLVNTLPLRIHVPLDAPLIPWLKEIRARWTSMRDYEHTPLDKIQKWSGLPPGQPLFDTVLNYDQEPVGESLRKLGGAWLNREFTRLQRTDSALTLAVYGKPVLSFAIIYDTRLFGPKVVEAMAGHLETLMESFLTQQDKPLGTLKMLTPREEQRLFASGAPDRLDVHNCAHGLVERQARRSPENIALDGPSGSVSYRRLNDQANRLARCLRARGAGPEKRIAVCVDRSPEAVIVILAVLKAGAAFVPLEADLPPERLAQMLECAQPKLVIFSGANLVAAPCAVVSLERLQEEMASQPAADLSQLVTPANAAYVVFTSGSTGRPKGVVVTHQSLVNHALGASQVFGISEADRRLQFASVGSDVFVAEVFNYLSRGAALVFGLSRRGTSAGDFLRFLHQHGITIAGIPSGWWAELVAALSNRSSVLPDSLRAVIVGMERADPKVLQTWKRLTGPSIRWFNAYGPAETTITATVYEAGSSAWEGESAVPIGKPLANTTAYVLDDRLSPAPVGVVGELFIGGAGVARGYLNSLELTTERFIPDPFSSDGRLYRTGDLAYSLPDGNLVFVARRDRQVKIRGYRIELEEIEAVLERHPAVQKCAVVVQSHGGQDRLVAYLTARAEPPGRDELLAHLSRYLPNPMLPAAFVALPYLPLTPGGKVDLQALTKYEPAQLSPKQPFIDPIGPVERRLATMWTHLFGISRVGRGDNFFELGGDSLTATRLITRIRDEFEKELDLAALLQAPTIERLAVMVGPSKSVGDPVRSHREAVIPIQPHGNGLPLFLIDPGVEGARLAKHFGLDRPIFGVPILASANPAAQRSIDEMAAGCAGALRRFRPQGPYALAGWCAAGVIALEVARQLEQQGSEIAFVAMLDVRNLFPPPMSPARLAFVRFWRRTRRLCYVARHWPASLRKRASSLLPSVSLPALPETTQALVRHRPLPWSGRMIHIWASDWPRGRYFDPGFAWNHLAPAGFVFYEVRGNHVTFLQEPGVAEVASLLAAELDRAGSEVRVVSLIRAE